MANDGYDATTGAPIFLPGGVPADAADLTEVAAYAAMRGNTLVGTTAERNAFQYPRTGMTWFDTTRMRDYVYNGTGWRVKDPTIQRMRVSIQALASANKEASVTLDEPLEASRGVHVSYVTLVYSTGAPVVVFTTKILPLGGTITEIPFVYRALNGQHYESQYCDVTVVGYPV